MSSCSLHRLTCNFIPNMYKTHVAPVFPQLILYKTVHTANLIGDCSLYLMVARVLEIAVQLEQIFTHNLAQTSVQESESIYLL